MAECFFHTGRPAVTRCKQCGKPLCSECRLVTEDGLFCGENCAQAGHVFVKKSRALEDKRPPRRKRIPGPVKFIIFLIILFIIYKQLVARGVLEELLQTIKKQ